MGAAKKQKTRGSGKSDANDGNRKERQASDPVRAIVACRPGSQQAAIGLHSSIRLVACNDKNDIEVVHAFDARCETSDTSTAANVIRAMAFGPDGAHLAVAGDDKALYVYDVDDGCRLRCRVVSPKKLGCVTWVSPTVVLAANKYGDVFAVDVTGTENRGGGNRDENNAGHDDTQRKDEDGDTKAPSGGVLSRDVLGHFCSIVLSLSVGRRHGEGAGENAGENVGEGKGGSGTMFLSSTDRDGKVRVTAIEDVRKLMLPHYNNEIQSFCLGHRSFVSGGVFVWCSGGQGGSLVLMTGGGDGVKVWDPMDGKVLWEGMDDRRVLEMVGGVGQQVLAVFDGELGGRQLGVFEVTGETKETNVGEGAEGATTTLRDDGVHASGVEVRSSIHDVFGMKKVSSVSVDVSRSVAWVIGVREDGAVGLELVKVHAGGECAPHVERIETTVNEGVFGGLPAWDVADSFFAGYYIRENLD